MPIYEYQCGKCGREFEQLVSRSDESRVTCSACGSIRVNRMLSAFAVGSAGESAAFEPGPCGACGAPERGSCGN